MELFVEQGYGSVLQLATGGALGVDVRDLLQLQGAFERDRVAESPTEVHEVLELAVLLGELRDLFLALDKRADLLGKRSERSHQLVPALERDAAVDCRHAHG